MVRKFIDLSQPLFNGMPRAKAHGDVKFWVDRICAGPAKSPIEISITHMEMATHIGTHIDAAAHFYPGARTIDQYEQDRFVGPAVSIYLHREGPVPVTAKEIREAGPAIKAGDMVLLYFGYADRFREESYHAHPYLADDAADYLLDVGINVLGVDTITPDMPGECRPPEFAFPIHTRLLPSDILVIENLGPGVKQILGKRVTVAAIPFRIEGADASPIVPLAIVEDGAR